LSPPRELTSTQGRCWRASECPSGPKR